MPRKLGPFANTFSHIRNLSIAEIYVTLTNGSLTSYDDPGGLLSTAAYAANVLTLTWRDEKSTNQVIRAYPQAVGAADEDAYFNVVTSTATEMTIGIDEATGQGASAWGVSILLLLRMD